MGTVAALLDGRGAVAALRRTLPAGHALLTCRSPAHLARVLDQRLLDAVIIGSRMARGLDLAALRARYPSVPVVVYGVFRSDDGRRALELDRLGVSALAIEGIDDPVVGDTVDRATLTRRRIAVLRDGPRALRLTEPLQRAAWEALVRAAGAPPSTATLSAALGVSREHLSRQFGAGGAPNLKRAVDFLQVVVAKNLLASPGYPPAVAARLLGYASPRQLRTVTRRVTRLSLAELPDASVADLLRRFQRAGMRSRA